jgi:hypothetical protein
MMVKERGALLVALRVGVGRMGRRQTLTPTLSRSRERGKNCG